MDSRVKTRFSQVIIDHSSTNFSIVRGFISKPPFSLENKIGRLFGLLEIRSNQPTAEALADFIINQIQLKYYQLIPSELTQIDIESYFESILQKLNIEIAAFIGTESIVINLSDVNILIGVVAETDLIFTQVGSINIFLLQKLSNNYRMIDVLETAHSVPSKPDPLKLFAQVINGRIHQNDSILLTTSNVFDYFSPDRIKNIVTQTQGEKSGMLFNLFEKISDRENFGLMMVEFEKLSVAQPQIQQLKKTDFQKQAKHDSMQSLVKTEDETQKMLTPSLLPEIKKYGQSLTRAFGNFLSNIRTSKNKKTKGLSVIYDKNLAKKTLSKQKKYFTSLKLPNLNIGNKIKHSTKQLNKISRPITQLSNVAFQKVTKNKIWRRLLGYFTSILIFVNNFYKRLPKKSRFILVTLIVLLIIFLGSIGVMNLQANRQNQVDHFNDTIAQAQSLANESEASLIYRDENLARKKLIDAKQIIAHLKPANQEQKNQITAISNSIEQSLEKLRHFVKLNDIVQIVNFKNLDGMAEIGNIFWLAGNFAFVQETANQKIYQADLNSRNLSAISSQTTNTGVFNVDTVVNSQEILLLNQTKNLFAFNTNNKTLSSQTLSLNSTITPVALQFFNNHLYLLDSTNNQIYRFSKISGGYGSSSNWLTGGLENFSDAVDMAVDGNIYVLIRSGQIIKFDRGNQVEFNQATVDPSIAGATKIKTDANTKNIYVLDPPTKRIVVYDKSGQLIAQYTSEQFDHLKDLYIDQQNKKIYVLNGSTILGLGLQD